MKVVVAGGTGFIGAPLCRELAQHGHDVTVVTRQPDRHRPVERLRFVSWEGGARGDEPLDEHAPPGRGFLAELCRAWEAEALRAEPLGVRVVVMRIGVVLGPGGGALARMAPPFRWGLGGPLGSGRQWMSWVHRDDVIGMMEWALAHPEVSGPVNATAPQPVTMRAFCGALGRVLRRPSWAPVPAVALRLLLGEMAEVILTGQRVLPRAALDHGYAFRYAELEPALRNCLVSGGMV
jgi:uncharacterized protein (TIGR01777 family)